MQDVRRAAAACSSASDWRRNSACSVTASSPLAPSDSVVNVDEHLLSRDCRAAPPAAAAAAGGGGGGDAGGDGGGPAAGNAVMCAPIHSADGGGVIAVALLSNKMASSDDDVTAANAFTDDDEKVQLFSPLFIHYGFFVLQLYCYVPPPRSVRLFVCLSHGAAAPGYRAHWLPAA